MEKYSDILRKLAQMLDDNFKGNLSVVIKELFDTLHALVRVGLANNQLS